MNESRQLLNYGYYILQLINVYFIFKISTKEEKRKIIISLVLACGIMCCLYILSIITKTSSLTYGNDVIKKGYKGWSAESHYIGHALLLLFPVVVFSIYNNLIKSKVVKILLISLIIFSIYMVGTKAPLFCLAGILVFSSILIIVELLLCKSKINFNNVLIIIATVFVVILVCVGVMHNTMLVTVTTGIGVLLLIAKIIFQGKTFLSELSRRLHV